MTASPTTRRFPSKRVDDRLQQIAVDHHDEMRHRGPQRFCTEAPCPALNDLLDSGDL